MATVKRFRSPVTGKVKGRRQQVYTFRLRRQTVIDLGKMAQNQGVFSIDLPLDEGYGDFSTLRVTFLP